MSEEIQKNDASLIKSNASVSKTKIGQGLMAGVIASLSAIELPRMFNQLVIFVLDGSGSMTYPGASGKSKGYEVHQAVINVLERLKQSKNKSSFDVAFWAFANETVEMFPVKSVKDVDLAKDCFNPCEFIKDYAQTMLAQPLELVEKQAMSYLEKHKDQNTKVLAIVLGDGAINDYELCHAIKERINCNELITFSSILFESANWQDPKDALALKKIKENYSKLASTDADYMSTVDPESIRRHMIQSITKLSNLG